MAQSAFPRRMSESAADSQPEFISLQDSELVLDALATDTGRQIIAALDEEALPPSELADAVDTSVQNILYHLSRLENAGIIEIVDTWYSSRGREMDVYAVAADPIVFSIGDTASLSAYGGSSTKTGTERYWPE